MGKVSQLSRGEVLLAPEERVLALHKSGKLVGNDVRDLRKEVQQGQTKVSRQLRKLEEQRELAESDQSLGRVLIGVAVAVAIIGTALILVLSPIAAVLAGIGVPLFIWGVCLIRGGDKTIAQVDEQMPELYERLDRIQQALDVLDAVK